MLESNNYLKCPGLERALAVFPEIFHCPRCTAEVEIWSDEKKRKCSACGSYLIKSGFGQPEITGHEDQVKVDILEYVDQAGVKLYYERYEAELTPAFFEYDKKFKIACEACKRYGTNFACPPFSPTFQEYIGAFQQAKTICIRIPQEHFMQFDFEDRYVNCFRTGKKLLEEELLRFRKLGLKIAGAGPCLTCEECGINSGHQRCRKPSKLIYSLESLGINLISLTQKGFNINLEWSSNGQYPDFVCVVGVVFINNKE